jgi:hypothetical protein
MIKIFIVTYNRPHYLNENLESLFSSDADPDSYTVEIINNMDLIWKLDDKFKNRVKKVHHQTLRPDWSCGHLARDWNAALVKGFGDLDNPFAKQVILCQDDVLWDRDWKERLDKIHETYTFYAADWGDALLSFLPDAVKKIGLFDERFATVGSHEGDYFLRAWLHNFEKSSVNDHLHRRPFNTTDIIVQRNREKGDEKPVDLYVQDHTIPFWKTKWGDISSTTWAKNDMDRSKIKQLIPYYTFYPYFEKWVPGEGTF